MATNGRRAVIVGAGIGGLTAATALRRAGIDSVVLERAGDIREIQLGLGIHLWQNALLALRHIDLDDEVAAAGVELERVQIQTWHGEPLSVMNVQGMSSKIGEPAIGIRRADLHRVLAGHVPDDALMLGAPVASFDQDDDGVTVRLSDGREVRGDVLIGADGIRSVVRAQLHGPRDPEYASFSWLATVPLDRVPIAPGTMTLRWGEGRGFIFFDLANGLGGWIANVNDEREVVTPLARSKAAVQERYAEWADPVPAIIDATDESAIFGQEILHRPPLKSWGTGRVTLLGDAAHPMIPAAAQGACQAIEDAVALAASLEGAGDMASALRRYESMRMKRTAMFQKRGKQRAAIGRWRNPVACWIRDQLLFKRIAPLAERAEEKQLAYDAGIAPTH